MFDNAIGFCDVRIKLLTVFNSLAKISAFISPINLMPSA